MNTTIADRLQNSGYRILPEDDLAYRVVRVVIRRRRSDGVQYAEVTLRWVDLETGKSSLSRFNLLRGQRAHYGAFEVERAWLAAA